MKKTILISSIFYAQAIFALNLYQAIDYTLDHHPQVLIARTAIQSSQEKLKIQQSLNLPNVQLQILRGRERTNSNNVPKTWLLRKENSINLTQSIFEGGKVYYNVRTEDANIISETLNLLTLENKLAFDVISSYIECLYQAQRNELALKNVKQHQEIADKILARYKGGAGKIFELQLANSRLKRMQTQQASIADDYELAKIKFASLTSLEAHNLEPIYELNELVDGDIEKITAITLNNNKAIQAAESYLESTKHKLNSVRAELSPKIKLQLSGKKNSNIDGSIGKDHSTTGSLVMSYDIFNGGATIASINDAETKKIEAMHKVSEAKRTALEDTNLTWTIMNSTYRRVKIAHEYLKQNQQVLTSYKKLFQYGQIELLSILDATNDVFIASLEVILANKDRLLAEHRLLNTMHLLLPSLSGIYKKQTITATEYAQMQSLHTKKQVNLPNIETTTKNNEPLVPHRIETRQETNNKEPINIPNNLPQNPTEPNIVPPENLPTKQITQTQTSKKEQELPKPQPPIKTQQKNEQKNITIPANDTKDMQTNQPGSSLLPNALPNTIEASTLPVNTSALNTKAKKVITKANTNNSTNKPSIKDNQSKNKQPQLLHTRPQSSSNMLPNAMPNALPNISRPPSLTNHKLPSSTTQQNSLTSTKKHLILNK